MSRDGFKYISRYLADWRQRKGWTLRELEKASGVNHSTISGLELGQIKPSSSVLRKLSEALGLDAEEKAKLTGWADSLAMKKISGKTKGLESALLLRSLALLAGIDASTIKHALVCKPSEKDYDATITLTNGKRVGIKISSADGTLRIGQGTSEEDLPDITRCPSEVVLTRAT
jgi:transcriptional regulator with XRE-family HTH domain